VAAVRREGQHRRAEAEAASIRERLALDTSRLSSRSVGVSRAGASDATTDTTPCCESPFEDHNATSQGDILMQRKLRARQGRSRESSPLSSPLSASPETSPRTSIDRMAQQGTVSSQPWSLPEKVASPPRVPRQGV